MNDALKYEIERRAALAREISRKSAEIALDFFGNAEIWNKEDSSPVTEADIAIDRQLTKEISSNFPDDAILSEESADTPSRLDKDFCWIIDPIDGTKEFIARRDDFCVMIGIAYKDIPVYGVINIPRTGELFYGGENFGVNLEINNSPVKLPDVRQDGDKILISRSHRRKIVLPYVEKKNLQAISCGSSGVKACRLVDGSADHYLHGTTIHEWDAAAADAIIRGAGGYFRGMDSKPFSYNKPQPLIHGIIGSFNFDRVLDVSSFFANRLSFRG